VLGLTRKLGTLRNKAPFEDWVPPTMIKCVPGCRLAVAADHGFDQWVLANARAKTRRQRGSKSDAD
jgi:hypothetical protein